MSYVKWSKNNLKSNENKNTITSVFIYPKKFILVPCTKFHNKYYATKALRELHDSSSIHSRRHLALLPTHLTTQKKIKIKKQNQGTSEVVGKKYKEMKEISVIIVIT